MDIATIVRFDVNFKEFCVSECVKSSNDTLDKKENKCLKNCSEAYQRAIDLVFEYEQIKK